MQEVYPQLVFENEGGLLSVNYIGLIPVLVEAIKELELQISDLKTELEYCCSGETNDNLKSGQIEGGNLGQEQTDCQSYLSQNRPNPFNTETIIDYYVCEQDYNAQIMVFDMTGKLLKTYQAQPGKQNLIINSGDFTPGMYYYSLVIAGNEIETKKMILSK